MRRIRIVFVVMVLLILGGSFIFGTKGCLWQKDDSTSGSSSPWRMITPSPYARDNAKSVWIPLNNEAIICGGTDSGEYAITGIKYSLILNAWSTISTTNAPATRTLHTVVWTGQETLIWGGRNDTGPLNDGGSYNPTTNTWVPITTTDAPIWRARHSAVWTGQEMIVFGGEAWGVGYSNDGGRYNHSTDTWSPITTTNVPVTRSYHTAIWTGTEMIIWGGVNDRLGYVSGLNDGAKYNPTTDTWTPITTTNAPQGGSGYKAFWTGTEMLVWGVVWMTSPNRYINDGAIYNPISDTWRPITTTGSPSPARTQSGIVWNGQEIFIWGGIDDSDNPGALTPFDNYIFFNDGFKYNPTTDTWAPLPSVNLAPRAGPYAWWTGQEMIIWGGYFWDGYNSTLYKDGAIYKP